MPEEVTYEPHNALMRVRAWGVDPIADWIASKKEVVQLSETHGVFYLLVDTRELTTAPSILDIFDFGQDWPGTIKTAILVGEETSEDVAFVETVAVNRYKQMQIFYDEDEALLWLRE
jgi:hypothetical protein